LDLRYQTAEHPWMALSGAVVAGYILGALEDERTGQSHDDALAPFEHEVALIKSAAVSTVMTFLHASIRGYVIPLSEQFDAMKPEQHRTIDALSSAMASRSGVRNTTITEVEEQNRTHLSP
jgi:hypothetical protein